MYEVLALARSALTRRAVLTLVVAALVVATVALAAFSGITAEVLDQAGIAVRPID